MKMMIKKFKRKKKEDIGQFISRVAKYRMMVVQKFHTQSMVHWSLDYRKHIKGATVVYIRSEIAEDYFERRE